MSRLDDIRERELRLREHRLKSGGHGFETDSDVFVLLNLVDTQQKEIDHLKAEIGDVAIENKKLREGIRSLLSGSKDDIYIRIERLAREFPEGK
jgi:hypothetical protein